MTKITYQLGDETGTIHWAAAEEFTELEGKNFHLGELEAKKIDNLPGLSNVAKILLSAVAGAVIQHLLDKKLSPEKIFSEGTFVVNK